MHIDSYTHIRSAYGLCHSRHLKAIIYDNSMRKLEFPWWLRWEKICLQCRTPGFNPWVGEIPWRRAWLPTPVFLPGESHGQRSLAGYSPWGGKESDTTE